MGSALFDGREYREFVALLKAATNEQLRERERDPKQPEWKRAAVRAEMDHRGI